MNTLNVYIGPSNLPRSLTRVELSEPVVRLDPRWRVQDTQCCHWIHSWVTPCHRNLHQQLGSRTHGFPNRA
jgi:hypothetical protein